MKTLNKITTIAYIFAFMVFIFTPFSYLHLGYLIAFKIIDVVTWFNAPSLVRK